MKGLRKFRTDNFVSPWLMARYSGLPVDSYLKFEGMKDENIPQDIRCRFIEIMEHPEKISEYYHNAEVFYKENDISEIFKEANIDLDNVAACTNLGLDVIKEILVDGEPFPDANTKDKIIDYAMWIKNNQTLKEEHENEQVPEVEEPNVVSPEDLQFPELPSQDVDIASTEGISKDEEIAGLNRQIDWYEDLLTCFTHLAELAYKNNK